MAKKSKQRSKSLSSSIAKRRNLIKAARIKHPTVVETNRARLDCGCGHEEEEE